MLMIKLLKTLIGSALIVFYMLLSACSTLSKPNEVRSDTENHTSSISAHKPKYKTKQELAYVIKRGDTLSKIAQRITGNRKNWVQIAKKNNIYDPAKLRIGQEIVIPRELILSANRRNIDSLQVTDQTLLTNPQSQASRKEERPQTTSLPYSTQAKPVPKVNETKETQQPDSSLGWIIIRGSYYPREVNREPDAISDVLLQVWPGTRLRYVERVNGWFKVITKQGTGYINPDYAFIENR